jgi:hypothetical protein
MKYLISCTLVLQTEHHKNLVHNMCKVSLLEQPVVAWPLKLYGKYVRQCFGIGFGVHCGGFTVS